MDRKEAAEIIKERYEFWRKHYAEECKDYGEALEIALEALQEPERKKGQWEDFDYDNSYLCTSCGEIWTLNDGTPEENNMNYCPNCGADMRGEKVDKKRSDRNIKEK